MKEEKGRGVGGRGYLLKLCVDLREEGGLLVLEEHAQRGAHVQVHDAQQGDGGRAHRRVGGRQRRLHVADEGFHVDPGVGRDISRAYVRSCTTEYKNK